MKLKLDLYETKLRMARRGITQKELAAKSGVSRQTLSSGMNGKTLSPAIVGRISMALECDPSEISVATESR